MVEAGEHGRVLPEVARQPDDHRRVRKLSRELDRTLRGPVSAAVVHKDELGGPPEIRDYRRQPIEERRERWERLIVSVRDENVVRWTENFTSDLAAAGA